MAEPRPSPVSNAPAFLARLALVIALLVLPATAAARGVDIDTADAATLAAALPGIGPVKARRIVEYRERHGPFGHVEALLAVKGIGPATVARIRRHLEESGDASGSGAVEGTGDGAASSRREPRSTAELERQVRSAVRRVVVEVEREAEPHR